MKKIILILSILFSLVSCEKEEPVTLAEGKTEQFTYTITTMASLLKTGRSLPLSLTITSETPELFTECELLGNSEFDITDSGELESSSIKNDSLYSMVNELVYLEPGEYPLPSYLVTGNDGPLVLTPEGTITIESSLIGEDSDFADIDPPVELPGPGTLVWILITCIPVAAALLLFLVYLILKKKRTRRRNMPLDTYCLKELAKLQKSLPFPDDEEKRARTLKSYYFKLTEIIRYFYDGIFKANTLEQTLEEYLPHVIANPVLPRGEKQYLIKMLNLADKIKFASFQPEKDLPLAHLEFCKGLIKSQAYRLQEQKEKKS